jgi:hypothetical protein
VHYDSERGGETSTRTQKSLFYVSARIIISCSFFFLVGFGVVSSRRVFEMIRFALLFVVVVLKNCRRTNRGKKKEH